MKRMKKTVLMGIKYIALILISCIVSFPFLWMLFGAFKTNNEIWHTPYKLFPSEFDFSLLLENMKEIKLSGYLFNSFFVGILGTGLILLVSAMFTYAVVFMGNKLMNLLFWVVMVTYMLPAAVTYVPSYVILANLKLLDTHTGLLFSYLANVFVVFYLRQSFMKTGKEFVEAAKIDRNNFV